MQFLSVEENTSRPPHKEDKATWESVLDYIDPKSLDFKWNEDDKKPAHAIQL